MRLLIAALLLSFLPALAADEAAAPNDPFVLIGVADLAGLLETKKESVAVYDANPDSVRIAKGVIPGAKLLSSSVAYDPAKELPPQKTTTLVFYCANVH